MELRSSFGHPMIPPLTGSQDSDEGILGEVKEQTLSQCLISLFAAAHAHSAVVGLLPIPPRNTGATSKPRIMREVFQSEEVKEKRRAVQEKVLSSDLNPKEQLFCLKLIDTYLSTPGYKKYQSFIKGLMRNKHPDIDFDKIQRYIGEIDKEIDQLKAICQKTYRENKEILHTLSYSAIEKFTSLSSTETVGQPLPSLKTLSSMQQKQKHVGAHLSALNVTRKILSMLPDNWDPSNDASENEFMRQFINILAISSSEEDFHARFDLLMNEVWVSKEFLACVLPILDQYKDDIHLLAQNHQRFKAGYALALLNAQESFLKLNAAFADEYEPFVDPDTKLITVSFARMRLALTLFHRDFKWMVELSSCEEEGALASHVLAVLLCGNEQAPTAKELAGRSSCFMIKEFSENRFPPLLKKTALEEGTSFVLHHLYTIERDASELPEDERFKMNMESAANLFVKDCIDRGGIKVTVGNDQFITGVIREEDLLKPFFLEGIIGEYVRFLKENHAHVKEAMASPLFRLAKKNYGKTILSQLFAGKGKDKVSQQAIEKIFDCMKEVPEHLQDLVLLKLLEQFIIFNQTLAGNICRDICGGLGDVLKEKLPKCFLMPRKGAEYSVSITPPQCEALSCQGILPLCMMDERPNLFFPQYEPIAIQFSYVGQIPSVTALEHTGLTNCPVISVSDFIFSPFATTELLDIMCSQINERFVEEQKWILSPDGISKAFIEIIANLENCDGLFEQLAENEKDALAAFLSKFATAFATDKKLDMLMLTQKLDVKTLRKLKESRKKLIARLEKTFDTILSHYAHKPLPERVQRFLAIIIKWFPEINH